MVLCLSLAQSTVVNEVCVGTSRACTSGGILGGLFFSLLIMQADPLDQRAWHSAHCVLPVISPRTS